MQEQSHPLKRARRRQGWSQEAAIVRIENLARSMDIDLPTRSSLRTLLSMFENGHRSVPEQGDYSLIAFPDFSAPELWRSALRKAFHNSTGKDERFLRMTGNLGHGNGPSF